MNPDEMDKKVNGAEFALELAKHRGASVITVKDGWVFIFSITTLETLLAKAKEDGSTLSSVFVKSTANLPKENLS